MIVSKKIRVFSLFLLLAGLSLAASVNTSVSANATSVNASIKPVNASLSNLTISLNVYPALVMRGGLLAFQLNVSDRGRLAILPPPTVCSASDPKCFGKLSSYCAMMRVSRNASTYYCVYNSLRNIPGNYSVAASVKDKSGKIVTSLPVNFTIMPKSKANINVTRTEFPVTTAYATLVKLFSKIQVQNSSAVSR